MYNISELGLDMLQYGIDYDNFELYKHYRDENGVVMNNETEIW